MTTRYLRPIADLRADAEKLADTLDHSSMPDEEVASVAAPMAELVYELITELEQWRGLIGQRIAISGEGAVTVLVAQDGIRLQGELISRSAEDGTPRDLSST